MPRTRTTRYAGSFVPSCLIRGRQYWVGVWGDFLLFICILVCDFNEELRDRYERAFKKGTL